MQKVYVVTGGSSGIGLAVVKLLAENSNNVVVSFSRSREKIKRAEATFKNAFENIVFVQGNVCEEKDCQSFFLLLNEKFGQIHGLVNAAGALNRGNLEKLGVDEWKYIMDVNLNGPFIVTQTLLPLLKNAGESAIVNVSSIAAIRPGTSLAYSVSKAALDMFTSYIAGELATYNIRVNAVSPGFVKTNLHYDNNIVEDKFAYEEMVERVIKKYPLKRAGEPAEIAGLICFLLSDKASWITGSMFKIDGGALVYNEFKAKSEAD